MHNHVGSLSVQDICQWSQNLVFWSGKYADCTYRDIFLYVLPHIFPTECLSHNISSSIVSSMTSSFSMKIYHASLLHLFCTIRYPFVALYLSTLWSPYYNICRTGMRFLFILDIFQFFLSTVWSWIMSGYNAAALFDPASSSLILLAGLLIHMCTYSVRVVMIDEEGRTTWDNVPAMYFW